MGNDSLKDLFYYDPTSPSGIRWKVNRYGGRNHSTLVVSAGTIAGSRQILRGQWKWRVIFNKKLIFTHNVVWQLINEKLPEGFIVDHFDGNTENNVINNLRLIPKEKNARNAKRRIDNSSEVTGVHLTDAGEGYLYWTATWRAENKRCAKHFSILGLGYDEAFAQAWIYRTEMLKQLNAQGAGYTNRHGV